MLTEQDKNIIRTHCERVYPSLAREKRLKRLHVLLQEKINRRIGLSIKELEELCNIPEFKRTQMAKNKPNKPLIYYF